jgi:hypothetical protein
MLYLELTRLLRTLRLKVISLFRTISSDNDLEGRGRFAALLARDDGSDVEGRRFHAVEEGFILARHDLDIGFEVVSCIGWQSASSVDDGLHGCNRHR